MDMAVMVTEEAMEGMVDTEAMDMAREKLKLKLSQAIEAMDMAVMVTEEAMEVMVDTEAMDMAREKLKLMLSQVTEAMAMVLWLRKKLWRLWWIQKLWIWQVDIFFTFIFTIKNISAKFFFKILNKR